MFLQPAVVAVMMLLFPSGPETENPWKVKVPAAVEEARSRKTVEAYQKAFDVAWRADDWVVGAKLADMALREHPDDATLAGAAARAVWRAGQLERAEGLAAKIPPKTTDRIALRTLIGVRLARGELDAARDLAVRLQALPDQTAEDVNQILTVRFTLNELKGINELLRKAERLVNTDGGYPESYIAEAIEGIGDFFDAVGTEPVNQIVAYGSAPMPPLVLLNLPSCDVMINGHGPYRLVVDTGGSMMVSLDEAVAREVGLRSVASASIRGVSGKQPSGQALIDELQIGTIRCGRVLTRVFGLRAATMGAADGVIGTGIFGEGRMTLDFVGGQLVLEASQDKPAAGTAAPLRLIGDAKLVVPIKLEKKVGLALLDTGADVVAMSPSRLERLFPGRKIQTFSPGVQIGVGAGELPEISLTPGVELVVVGRTYTDCGGLGLDVLDTILSPVLGVQLDVLIGMATFRDMRSCTVDFPKCRMWIDWLERE